MISLDKPILTSSILQFILRYYDNHHHPYQKHDKDGSFIGKNCKKHRIKHRNKIKRMFEF